MASIINSFLRPSSFMLMAGVALLSFFVVKNYTAQTPVPPATASISQDVKKRKHGKVKKGARDPIKSEAGAWVYGNVANDDISAGEGWTTTGQMNNRSLQWMYGKPTPMGMYPADDAQTLLSGTIPYVGMDLSGGDAINEVVKQKGPKAMYARMIKRGGY